MSSKRRSEMALERAWRVRRHPRHLPDVLLPTLVATLKGYTRQQFAADLGAGAMVRIVTIPLAA
jgi:hypothetical protein